MIRGFDALRTLLGYEYSSGSWFKLPVHEKRTKHGNKPFGRGKDRPVILATPLGPDAVLYPRSTKSGNVQHDAHRHDPPGRCEIDKPGWVILAVSVVVDTDHLNDKTYSCEEPEDSPLLTVIRNELRP